MDNKDFKQQLAEHRVDIDKCDKQIIEALSKRMKVVEKVGILKKQNNIPPLDPARWQQVLTSKIEKAKSSGLDPKMVKKIYNIIHDHALKIEKST